MTNWFLKHAFAVLVLPNCASKWAREELAVSRTFLALPFYRPQVSPSSWESENNQVREVIKRNMEEVVRTV